MKTAFLPHIGLGEGYLDKISLPDIFYNDPVPLLFFDKIYIDKSVERGSDWGDEFELKILEILVKNNIAEVYPFTENNEVDNRCYKLFNWIVSTVNDKHIVSPDKEINIEEFNNNIRKLPRDINEAFAEFKEVYWTLQISKDYNIPYIQNNQHYLWLADIILSFNKKKPKKKPIKDIDAFNHIKQIMSLHTPSIPLMVTDSGKSIPKIPIFLRRMAPLGLIEFKQEIPLVSEERSLDNINMLLELRNSKHLIEFRSFINKITKESSNKNNFKEEVIKNYNLKILEMEYLIAEEYKWLNNFVKTLAYTSIPLTLGGFAFPILGAVSTALGLGSFAGEVVHHTLKKRKKESQEFYKAHPEYSWNLFFSDLNKHYSRDNILESIQKNIKNLDKIN